MSGKQFSLDSRLDLFHGIESYTTLNYMGSSTNPTVLEDSNEFDENCGNLTTGWAKKTDQFIT